MKSRQLRIGLMFLAMFAFLMIILLRFVGGSKPPQDVTIDKPKVDTVEVLVARTDIGMGQVATQANFRWQAWPSEAVSESFITRSRGGDGELSGSIVRSPILAGEPITAGKLVKAGQGGVLAAILPKGMRAISTRIKEETAAGRMILPNDRVDVILTRRLQSKTGQGETFVADTLYRNVRVLAVGQQIDVKDGKKSDAGANTATLELTPSQAEQLALANSTGEISLTLRPIADLLASGEAEGQSSLNKDRKNSIRVLKYGQPTRAFGVN